jgi:tRNA pseudouridine38-40 synthase
MVAPEQKNLLQALNAKFPPDLAVRKPKTSPADFHPRFDARSRMYRYRLFCEPIRDPLRERFAWRIWPHQDGNALKQNAGIFLGTHDFAAFGSPTTLKRDDGANGDKSRVEKNAQW